MLYYMLPKLSSEVWQ